MKTVKITIEFEVPNETSIDEIWEEYHISEAIDTIQINLMDIWKVEAKSIDTNISEIYTLP